MNVPSITGKTLGTNNNDWLGVFIWTSAGSNNNASTNSLGLQTIGVDLWGIHIRQGTWTAAATADYRPRDPGTELALCQRYYRTGTVYGFGYAPSASALRVAQERFGIWMRAVPSIGFSGQAYSNASGLFVDNSQVGGIGLAVSVTGTGYYTASANYTADAEL